MSPPQRILAIDDDPSLLALVSHILQRDGYQVAVAADGAEGLARIRSEAPDLVICDVQMPVMDGFATLESVRADSATASLPFVLLTALGERDNVRRGMRLGADDFLSKPVHAEELLESIHGVLEKRRRLVSHGSTTGRMVTQTVLFSDIRGFTAISERLPATEIAELLSRYLREACQPILQERGRIMKIMGDGLMAAFGQDAPDDVGEHAGAALRAGLRILEVAQKFRQWLEGRFDMSGLPPFEVGVGVHTGQVMLFKLSAGGLGDLTAVGDTVNVAARLETSSKDLGWPMVASMATVEAAGPTYQVAETREIELAGREARIQVGRLASVATTSPRPISHVALSAGIRAALEENARSTAVAAKQEIDSTLHSIDDMLERPAEREPVIRGYRVLAKIGEGGMSTVYLAEEESQRRKAVLKVLNGRRGDDEELWKRFFQECAILSGIHHEHVVKIYDQGFGEELAYIAMEHLGGGSLREVIDRGLSARQSLSLLSQAASALAEIHRHGIVHRDIKPPNLLLRTEGVLVLTDFGVAKRLEQGAGQTMHGVILGTPYYLSPEQAQSGAVTPQTDLYSLGVIFYEMLTGTRPYRGDTISEILAQHTAAPIPRLAPEHADYQDLVDGMLAKKPADRFADADAVLNAIDHVWTQQALKKASL